MRVATRLPGGRFVRSVGTLALVLVASGCFRLPAFTPQGMQLSQSDSTVLCEALPTLKRQGPHTFRALLDTSLNTPNDESFSFRYAIASKQPKYLRVDLLPTEGAYTLGLLTVQDGRALVIDSQAKTYSSGCEVNAVFEKFFSLQGITPDLVQALITGRSSGVRCESVQAYRQPQGRVLFVDSVSRHAWEVDESSGKVRLVTLLDSSLLHVQARATRLYSPDEESIRVEIYRPVTASALMKIRKFAVNPDISDSLFQISAPSGYQDEGC